MMGAPLDGAGLQRIVELAGSGLHLAFQAGDRAAVERFHSAALQAGGVDNGTPGVRTYGAGYYAAYVRDPDGNNIEAVVHEGQRPLGRRDRG